MALDFDQWLRISPLLCFFSGAPVRFGFRTGRQYRHFLYHQAVLNDRSRHEFEQFASVAGLAGVQRRDIENYSGFLDREKLFQSQSKIKTKSKSHFLILFHPGCGSHGLQREWPADYYARLAQGLQRKLDVKIQITGLGNHEEALAKEITEKAGANVDNLSGHSDFTELADLIRKADLVVCGNTGIMHLAAGLGRPLIALHGPTDPVKWGPVSAQSRIIRADLLCSPCLNLGFEYGCKFRCCMEAIEVETVLAECLQLIKT